VRSVVIYKRREELYWIVEMESIQGRLEKFGKEEEHFLGMELHVWDSWLFFCDRTRNECIDAPTSYIT
jgi:hypothetical protein